MDYNYTLKYRTFDSLLEDVKMDLRNLAADTSIEPGQLIKIARKCNYDLGLRIQRTREIVLEICKGKARLPEDFQVMNFALICGNYSVVYVPPQGTNVQEIVPGYRPWIEANTCSDVNGTSPETTCMTQCGTDYTLVQMVVHQDGIIKMKLISKMVGCMLILKMVTCTSIIKLIW
jgi:hypothetical protein